MTLTPSPASKRGVTHFPKSRSALLLTLDVTVQLKKRHGDILRIEADDYIQNHLPIRLLDLSTMALVDRKKLQNHISEKIEGGHFLCEEVNCRCIDRIKEELKYSILSHRWGSSEITFSEFGKLHEQATRGYWENTISFNASILKKMQDLQDGIQFKTSLVKLHHFQEVSVQRQCKYGWVDTVCINKESSAELDESIRSMYAWYRDSQLCVVHLAQTSWSVDMKDDPWFTRGWTLQELLAPKQIKFFSASWEAITRRENDKALDSAERQTAKEGKDSPPLWSTINKITGVPIDDLLDFKPGLYDIGKRMVWASKRRTTRVEDMAYCLIGIFCVNLSIAYGEKEGAFYRLQAEIMQNSDDRSLLDWQGPASAYNSMFAASPQCFSQALGLTTDENHPTSPDHISHSSVNFERRMSLIVYNISEVPDLASRYPGPTAFTILGRSVSKPEQCVLMILGQIGGRQRYKRLAVIEEKIVEEDLSKKGPSEIIIKWCVSPRMINTIEAAFETSIESARALFVCKSTNV
ncbi:hypothetical protein FRC16_011513 [Serendipita sp. 398]|nr:hypothetical protein FRC16_011513 [Serendipita sp. 398]